MRRTRFHHYLAAWLLLLLFIQAVNAIPALSVTVDEPVHALTGYSILRTGDLRLLEDHPPLIEMWLGWPLLLSPDIPHPAEVPSWQSGDWRLLAYDDYWWQQVPVDDWLFPARFTNVLLSLLLGALLYRWATDWFGSRAGLLALGLFACDPNILAHASLATLDLGVTALIFATLYSFQRCLRRPTTTRVIGAGLLLGLALSAKISAAPLPPLTAALMLIWGLKRWEKKVLLRRLALFASSAFLALWAAHLFQIGATPGLPFRVPAPTYWHSFFRVGQDASGGARYSFLLGELYQGGCWYYFPVALLLKTPLPTLLLSIAALVKFWRRPLPLWRMILLRTFPISYLLVSIAANINIGYRHILPLVPFLYLAIGSLGARIPARQNPKSRSGIGWKITPYASRSALLALLLWQLGGTLA
ncbi:MAG: glycosyltransferase family 39 protein, partial [Anaerolineae bacterium]|nr:glycosyltransferase family 39 protein [Anaerolineae bacterium]